MNPPSDFKELVNIFIDLINVALPVIGGLAFLVFLWGLTKFIINVSGDAKGVEEGKNLMLWGIIALFLLLSFWAIIAFFYRDIGFARSFGIPFLPQ